MPFKLPLKSWLILIGSSILLILAYLFFSNAWFQTHAGYTYVYQNNISGKLYVYTEPSVQFRMPIFSKVERYKQVMTVAFNAGQKTGRNSGFTASQPPINVRFADTYTGKIPTTFRFKLSGNTDKILQMHKEFRNFNNLTDALLVKNARNVTIITATQYTGEEFFQGGLNQFKTQLEDQLRRGIYVTERKQVEIEQMDLAPVGSEQTNSNKLQRTKQIVWKTVPIYDSNGQLKRQANPLDQYGIQVTQVTVGDPVPEQLLNKLLADKKALVAERIKTIQEQETAKAQAKTEQLKKEIQRTRAVQDAQRAKELAVIAQQKEVEIARQVAIRELVEKNKQKDVAVVQKAKELAIAKANQGIQQANAEAAKYEAQAIMEKGKAQAEVIAAKYAALGAHKEIYLAEIQRDIAEVLYNNLRHFRVEMPHNYVTTANHDNQENTKSTLTSNLDVISAFGALNIMDIMGSLPQKPTQTQN